MNEEKALQQVLSMGTKAVHPLIRLLDDLSRDSGHLVGLGTQVCCHIAASRRGKAVRGREKCQKGHANTAVAGDHRACQIKASLLSQRNNARWGGEGREEKKKKKGGREVL